MLRNDLDLHGPRFGCGLGQCGACTVLINGEAVRSCVRPVSSVQGAEITTLESLASNGKLHPVQQAWIDEQVPQCGFCQNGQIASESFIDELAAAAKADPVELRLKLLTASEADDGGLRRARSIACCAHDCGLVINPEALRRALECGMLHSLSRALHEEVRFDNEKVTSVDWMSHPTLRHTGTPATIDIVLVNGDSDPKRPDLPHYGAGETVCKPTLAAVANAVFDATGVRLRRIPFRDARVLAALKAAGV